MELSPKILENHQSLKDYICIASAWLFQGTVETAMKIKKHPKNPTAYTAGRRYEYRMQSEEIGVDTEVCAPLDLGLSTRDVLVEDIHLLRNIMVRSRWGSINVL